VSVPPERRSGLVSVKTVVGNDETPLTCCYAGIGPALNVAVAPGWAVHWVLEPCSP
jgi:hypothetical protein